jgi:flagellar protein FliJ
MSSSLDTLLQHAEHQRDQAMAALQQAEDAIRRLLAQAEQLNAYRGELQARDPARGGRAAPIEVMRCHLAFVERLTQAQTQQQTQVASAQQRSTELRNALLAHETRVASVKKLIERREQAEQHQINRKEQRRDDEAAAQKLWRDRAENPASP